MSNTFTPEEISALESAWRRIAVIPHADGEYEYVIAPAERLQWRDFRGKATSDDATKADAQEGLVMQTVVAVAYAGDKAIALSKGDKAKPRELLKKLLEDWTSATDGAPIRNAIFKVNGEAGSRAK